MGNVGIVEITPETIEAMREQGSPWNLRYPLRALGVGEVLVVPYGDKTPEQLDSSLRAGISRAKSYYGMQFKKWRGYKCIRIKRVA